MPGQHRATGLRRRDGNNVVALEPGVVVAYERNTGANAALRKGASRSSPSRASSWAAAAAAGTA
jgi:hypothetical protein